MATVGICDRCPGLDHEMKSCMPLGEPKEGGASRSSTSEFAVLGSSRLFMKRVSSDEFDAYARLFQTGEGRRLMESPFVTGVVRACPGNRLVMRNIQEQTQHAFFGMGGDPFYGDLVSGTVRTFDAKPLPAVSTQRRLLFWYMAQHFLALDPIVADGFAAALPRLNAAARASPFGSPSLELVDYSLVVVAVEPAASWPRQVVALPDNCAKFNSDDFKSDDNPAGDAGYCVFLVDYLVRYSADRVLESWWKDGKWDGYEAKVADLTTCLTQIGGAPHATQDFCAPYFVEATGLSLAEGRARLDPAFLAEVERKTGWQRGPLANLDALTAKEGDAELKARVPPLLQAWFRVASSKDQ